MAANKNLAQHEDYKQLAAMAALNELTASERLRLQNHVRSCEDCAEIYRQYLLLRNEGMPFLDQKSEHAEDLEKWADGPWREKLFDRIYAQEQKAPASRKSPWDFVAGHFPRLRIGGVSLALAAAGISFFLGGKVLGNRRTQPQRLSGTAETQPVDFSKDKPEIINDHVAEDLQRRFDEKTKRARQLESDQEIQKQRVEKMRTDLAELTDREAFLVSLNTASKAQLKELSEQRDAVKRQLLTAEESYATVQSRLAVVLGERDVAVGRNATLESKIAGLSVQVSNQRRQIEEDEQFLNSDRDIRELMGARQLYIADVFDVDSHSRTRPAFGRIFYTHGKSLIFYAFDLDSQKGVVTASAFQVWGKGANAKVPRSLGILYLDNESNRRWLLRSDDAEQLEKIDSVFVTVEPRGGSAKPTGRPFLYALLRKEPNHP